MTRRASPEFHLQVWYARWLDARGVLYCANLGGLRLSMGAAIKAKRMGYRKGVADITIYEPRGSWHGLLAELKVGTRPSLHQLAWQKLSEERGYKYIIVPHNLSFQEAQDWLEKETTLYLNSVPPANGGNRI